MKKKNHYNVLIVNTDLLDSNPLSLPAVLLSSFTSVDYNDYIQQQPLGKRAVGEECLFWIRIPTPLIFSIRVLHFLMDRVAVAQLIF